MKLNLKKQILTIAIALLIDGTVVAQSSSGVHVGGNVFGGGNNAKVNGNTEVAINQVSANVIGDVYGGGALAESGTSASGGTPATTHTVTLTNGTVRDIYGGGLGQITPDNIEAHVHGTVEVIVNGGKADNVFGCNNLNGTPKSTVEVTVNGSDATIVDGDTGAKIYAIKGVYGGGNQAHYLPTTITKEYPKVTVNGCATSIENVYGGGKAAGVSQTNVIINGGDIGRAFAGGDGDNANDTPAHVGYDNTDATPSTSTYPDPTDENGVGDVNILVKGGTIVQVFGGSNKNGVIRDNVNIEIDKNTGTGVCEMHLNEVYGGGNMAPSKSATNFTIGCTGGVGEGIDNLYGGANQADVTGDIVLDIVDGRIGNVFGGNNTSGSIDGSITVNINMKDDPCGWYVGNVFGGGNHAEYNGTPDVNIINGTVSGNVYGGGNDITTANAGVTGSDVVMTGGVVLGGIYGGCNLKGTVTGNALVQISGGTVGSPSQLENGTVANIFGGGYGSATSTTGNVLVNIDGPTVNIYGDVYGGSALGNVNTDGENTTIVNILDGTLHSMVVNSTGFPVYRGGNVYGGGLGDASHLAAVYGVVTVNIGTGIPDPENPFTVLPTEVSGNATIGGNVYGCNNTAGMPQQDVTVNVFQTAHTPDNSVDSGTGFAIANVFGGGNQANYTASGDIKVNIYTCDNTIGRVFGGGDAAATKGVETKIQGGRFGQVFGGGNGETGAPGADVNGDATLNIYGGIVGEFYGGSNQNGTISGSINIDANADGPCGGLTITDFFCGGNFVEITGGLTTTIGCSPSDITITNLYGGCNQAKITGDVTLNVEGGHYANVFAGSKGRLRETNGPEDPGVSANIDGNVTLNLYGGTIENAFGGSNVNGNITGTITVNVVDMEDSNCPLYVTNIFGGSNLTDYKPTYNPAPGTERITPVVNVIHSKYGISGDVYGGSKGEVGSGTELHATPLVNIGYDAATMLGYVPTGYQVPTVSRAIVAGSVFGGGDAAKVVGNTEILLRNRAKVFGNVYGGGNMGEVTGNTKVIVNGAND